MGIVHEQSQTALPCLRRVIVNKKNNNNNTPQDHHISQSVPEMCATLLSRLRGRAAWLLLEKRTSVLGISWKVVVEWYSVGQKHL